MAQPKGSTGNPNGRPTGSKNAKTEQWEALGHALVSKHSERANAVLDNLDDEKFLDHYGRLLEYFKPKLGRSNIDVTSGGEPIRTPNIIIPGPETVEKTG